MAALPENYVSLLQLRERWHKRQQEAEESPPLDTRPRPGPERSEGNDRKRSTDGRKPERLLGKGREKEEHRAGDIADRRRGYYWGQNKDGGGGEGRGRRRMAVPVAEGSAREQRCVGRSESEVGCCAATPKDGWKLPREKEIVESSCFASAVVEDSNGKEVKRGDCRPKSSDQRQRSFKRSDSGPARAKEDDAGGYWPRPFGRNNAGGNWPRPFGRNDAGGKDDGGSPRELAAFAEESGALERPSTRRSDFEFRLEAQKSTIPPMDSGGIIRKAIVEDSGGKEAKSEVFHKKRGNSMGKSHGKNNKDAGVVGAQEGQGGGNWQRGPLKRNEDADIGNGRRQKDVVASVAEIAALEQRSPRRSDSEVVSVDGMPTTVPHEAFHKKRGKSKRKRHWKYKKDAGVVGLEEGQGGGNWQRHPFQRNEDADVDDGISRRDAVASVAEIVALGRHLPRRSDSEVVSGDHLPTSVPDVLESPPPEKELIRSVCFTGTVVEESSAKEEKRSNKETKKPDVVREKDDEDRLDNKAEDVHDAPAESMKEECRGNGMTSEDDLKRSNNYQQKGFKKTKSGVARIREEEEQVGKLADGHNMPLEAVTLPGGKETERVASEGKALEVNGSGNGRRVISGPRNNRFSYRERIVVGKDNETLKYFAGKALEVNGSGNGRRVISGPRKNRFSYRERIVVGEDNETQKDFDRGKEAVNKEVEPANKNSRTEGKLGEKQKNGISSKEMVFRSYEGEVTRRLRDFSIGSSGRRGGREQRLSPWAENSRSWSIGNSGRKNGVLVSYMDRDMVWVKKGDVLSGNNKDDVTQAH